MQSTTGEYITLIAFPELKDAMPYAMALSEAGIQHRVSEKFRDFDPTFAGNRSMDQVKVEVLASEHAIALEVITALDAGAEIRVLPNTLKRKRSSTGFWIATTVVFLMCTLYFANRSENNGQPLATDGAMIYKKHDTHSTGSYRLDTGEMVSEETDADANGINEKGELYDQRGEIQSAWYDRDQNGWIDEWRKYDRLGRLSSSSIDKNGDGLFEIYIEHRTDGDVEYFDLNGDGYYDPDEIVTN